MPLVLTAAQMRAIDRAASARLGLPSAVLMENAGRGVAEVIAARCRRTTGLDVRIVCGAGQNGGDGFVAARHLHNRGAHVRVLLAAPRAKVAGDAAVFAAIVEAMGTVPVEDLSSVVDEAVWRERLAGAGVVIDALFGTGLRAAITGPPAAAIRAINAASGLRVCVDLPSGLDADAGCARSDRGEIVRADVTVTMAALKVGLVVEPSAPVGRVEIVDIGISPEALVDAARAVGPLTHWIDGPSIRPLWPRRASGAHKGSAGHLLLVAGSAGKTGAALLSARGALHAGAGLVTVASTAAGQAALDAKVVEAMTACYAAGEDADEESTGRLLALTERMRAVALGPGIPTGPGMRALVQRLAAELPLPLALDADALNHLGSDAAGWLERAPAPRVLTPHPGEMARLTGTTVSEVQADRLGAARRLAAASRAIVVLKGARTVVAEPDGTAHVNPTANPSLGTGGTGDVLLGMLGALLAQGLSPEAAARAAVWAHGESAVEATVASGTRVLVAGDLPNAVGRVLERELRARGDDGDLLSR